MCGIIGVFGAENSGEKVSIGLKTIKYRGHDGSHIVEGADGALGHCLHSIVGRVDQPLTETDGKGSLSAVFISNCEIYNWKELDEKYALKARNDAEALFRLLLKKNIHPLDELDGVYAFAFLKGKTLLIARDIIGVKPVW